MTLRAVESEPCLASESFLPLGLHEFAPPRARNALQIYTHTIVGDALEYMASCDSRHAVLLLVWPPCWSEMPHNVVRSFNGDWIVYVGEPLHDRTPQDRSWAATASASLIELLQRSWSLDRTVPLPNWPDGARDHLAVYRRLQPCGSPATL